MLGAMVSLRPVDHPLDEHQQTFNLNLLVVREAPSSPKRSQRLHEIRPAVGEPVVPPVGREEDGKRPEVAAFAPGVDQSGQRSVDWVVSRIGHGHSMAARRPLGARCLTARVCTAIVSTWQW
jgi:hypothetical protein